MMSQTAFFVKDVVGPKGSVSIAAPQTEEKASDDVNAHTKTESLVVHHAELDANGNFARKDDILRTDDEPDHDELCAREQAFFAKAILENLDLAEHLGSAFYSLQVVLAAEQSAKTAQTVTLEPIALSSIISQ